MTKVERKIILAKEEFRETSLGKFFLENGYELKSAYDPSEDACIHFLVDDVIPGNKKHPRLATTIGDNQSIYDRAGIFYENINEDALKLLSNYFTATEELDLIDRYSKELKDLFTLKIQDYLNFGYFIDTIIVEAYKGGFDISKMRKYLNHNLEYIFRLVESKGSLLPLEVSFAHDGKQFVVQVATTVKEFKLDKDFLNKDKLTSQLLELSNFFDLTYIESRDRLIISTLWFKENTNFQSYFYTVVEKRKVNFNSTARIVLEKSEEKVLYQPHVAKDKSDLTKSSIVRKLALFIQKNHKNDNFDFKTMTLEQVIEESKNYPIKSEIKDLDERVYPKVLELIHLMDATTTEEEITKFQEDIEKEERHQVGGKVEVDQSKTIVKGNAEEKDNSKTTISGSEEEAAGKITIDGTNENNTSKTNEVQEIKTIDNSLELQVADLDRKLRALEVKHAKYVEQNGKMKKIIDQFKAELVKNKLATTTTTSIDPNTGETIISAANGANAMTMEEIQDLKNREKMLSKAKTDLENLLASKELRITQLESRVDGFKAEFLKTKEFADKERLLELESENKMLQAKVDLVNKNLASVVSNKENKENDTLLKREREVETLKTQMQMAQTLINKFKKEKNDLEEKYRGDAEELRRLKLEMAKEKTDDKKGEAATQVVSNKHALEAEKQQEERINALIAERKIIEDKYKEQSLEFKKLEHKLKMANSQIEEVGRKNKQEKGKGQASDTVMRQLEFANKKLTETTDDLTEKKRDLIKLKQENQQLNAKLQEVEKKLLMMVDKKAA
jgi:hypothetical protein